MSVNNEEFGRLIRRADEPKREQGEFGPLIRKASDGPGAGRVAAGLATEIGIGVSGQAAGTALAPFSFGLSYPILSFGSGVLGSAAAQNIEGRESFSWGRAVADGLLNMIPGGKVTKGAITGGKELTKEVAKQAAIKGAAGTGIGAGYVTIESVIDEGELPTAERVAMGAVTGALLGTGLGAGGTLASNTVKKYMNAPQLLDADLAKGNEQAAEFVSAVEKKLNVNPYQNSQVFLNSMFNFGGAPSRVVRREITATAQEAQLRVRSANKFSEDLQKKIKSETALMDNPAEANRIMNDYVAGQITQLPPALKTSKIFLDEARIEISQYQQQLIDNHYNGTHVLDDALLSKIEESLNSGDYVTRSYRWFSDSSYEPSATARQKLKAAMTRSLGSVEEAETFIRKLDEDKATQKTLGDVGRFFAAKDANVLKGKSTVSPELREYLGEIVDPAERMGVTVSNLARLVAFDTADQQIKRTLIDAGIATPQRQQGSVPLTLRRGEQREKDNLLFVPKYTQDALNKVYGMASDISMQSGIAGTLFSLYRNAIGISKLVKVPLNPPSYAVQLYGNLSTLMGMGMNPFRGAGKGVSFSLYDFTSELPTAIGGAKASRAILNNVMGDSGLREFKRMRSLGLIDSNVAFEDLKNALREDAIGTGIRKISEPIGKAYAGPDTAMRIIAYENHKSGIKNWFPDSISNPRAIESVAAEITNNTYQNYNMLSDTIRQLSRYGVLGQFSAFFFELMRNQYNQGRYIKRMLTGEFAKDFESVLGRADVDAIRREGAKRLAALSAVYGTSIGGMVMFNRNFGGVSESEEKAFRESVLPGWDEQSSLGLYRNGDKIYYKNMSYVVPHLDAAKMAMAGFRGESPEQAFGNVTKALYESVGGEGDFVLQNLFPALQNYNPSSGRPISGSPTAGGQLRERGGYFLEKTFLPGFLREFNALVSTDRSISQAMIRQIGIRVNDTTVEDGAGFRFRAVADRNQVVKQNLGAARYRTENNPQEFQQAYARLNEQYQGNIAEIRKHAENYKTLGYTEEQIITWAKDSGISGKDILFALDGASPNLPKAKRQTPSSVLDDILTSNAKDPIAEINAIEDQQLRQSVRRQYQENRKRESRGVTARDQIVMGLGVSDGARAEYVFEMMQSQENPEAYLRSQIQKGVVTEQVLSQIMTKKRASETAGATSTTY